jgi:hypothetical protein
VQQRHTLLQGNHRALCTIIPRDCILQEHTTQVYDENNQLLLLIIVHIDQ